jgi:DNA topoisomerase-1
MKLNYNISKNGIKREKNTNGYCYYNIFSNDKIINQSIIDRINCLGIPPAWTNVIISNNVNSHIQVIGEDIKGRKQYIYNKEWVKQSDIKKFKRIESFILFFHNLLKKCQKDIQNFKNEITKELIISVLLFIIFKINIRPGNDIYHKENNSIGACTLTKSNIKLKNSVIYFTFKGKSGIDHNLELHNKNVYKIIKILIKYPGEYLFQYPYGETGYARIHAETLNEYINSENLDKKNNYTVKDIRTYNANRLFLKYLCKITSQNDKPDNEKIILNNINKAVQYTAKELGHKPSISKKSYIGNFIFKYYSDHPEKFMCKSKDHEIDDLLLYIFKKCNKTIT